MKFSFHRWFLAGSFALTTIAAGCSSSPDQPAETCVEVRSSCQPLYDPPSYANIFSKTLQTSCATGNGTCHTPDARMGGLYFVDPAQTYDLLTGKTDGRTRVLPDRPGCSILAQRLKSSDPSFRMPKGAGLSDAELCDFELWMSSGAAQ